MNQLCIRIYHLCLDFLPIKATTEHWVEFSVLHSKFSLAFHFTHRVCMLSRVWLFAIPLGSSVHGIFQARILEWAVISSSWVPFQTRDRIRVFLGLLHCRQIPYCLSHQGSPLSIHQCIHSMYRSIPISQFIPVPHSPLVVSTFVPCVCVSISALQISSFVPFF